jgi:hypothetical protein
VSDVSSSRLIRTTSGVDAASLHSQVLATALGSGWQYTPAHELSRRVGDDDLFLAISLVGPDHMAVDVSVSGTAICG